MRDASISRHSGVTWNRTKRRSMRLTPNFTHTHTHTHTCTYTRQTIHSSSHVSKGLCRVYVRLFHSSDSRYRPHRARSRAKGEGNTDGRVLKQKVGKREREKDLNTAACGTGWAEGLEVRGEGGGREGGGRFGQRRPWATCHSRSALFTSLRRVVLSSSFLFRAFISYETRRGSSSSRRHLFVSILPIRPRVPLVSPFRPLFALARFRFYLNASTTRSVSTR